MPLSGYQAVTNRLKNVQVVRPVGQVTAVKGGVIIVKGLSDSVAVGDILRLERRARGWLDGEVLNVTDDGVVMLPENAAEGVAIGNRVVGLGPPSLAPSDSWLGRIVDPMGLPLDGLPLLPGKSVRTHAAPPPAATQRRGFGARLSTGLNLFDTLLPLVRGQRLGLFAGSGVGKSRLLADFARNSDADVIIIALVGERGREVGEFVRNVLGAKGMKRSIVVAATSDRSALSRRRCALAATSIAEHFRDEGADVLLLVDSVTRFAEAHREVAIAAGELPAMRGFPASVAHQIMSLCERSGPGLKDSGDISAIYSVLVAGSDMEEPIADILRGVLDGHIVLDRKIAERGRFPAVDVIRSVSRSLPEAATDRQNQVIQDVRKLLAAYNEAETMVRAGLYRDGSDPLVDQAIRAHEPLDNFFSQQSGGDIEAAFHQLALIQRRSASRGAGNSASQSI